MDPDSLLLGYRRVADRRLRSLAYPQSHGLDQNSGLTPKRDDMEKKEGAKAQKNDYET